MQELEENFKKNGGSFEKYKIKTLFNIKPTSGYSITNDKLSADKGKNPVVTNSELNLGRTIFSNFPTTESNIITFSDTGTKSPNTFFFQEGDFIGYSHVQGMYPLTDAEKWQKYACMYIIPFLKKQSFGTYDYSTKMTRNIVSNFSVILPVKCGAIAFDYMENYVKELEQCYIRDLNAYLKATGLDNYELTEEEKECIELKLDFKDYILSELFDKKTVKGVPKSEEDLTENKNGYLMYGQNIKPQYPQKILLDEKYLQKVEPNQPILGYTSSVGEIGIIEESFYRSGNNGAFQGLFAKEHKYNKYELLYVLTILRKYFNDFGYATSMANIMDLMVKLPIKQNAINYSFMENYIKAIEKLVIKDLVDWKNKEIETAKEVVNN